MVYSRLVSTDIEDWNALVEVRATSCREAKPVATIMQITRSMNPEWLVEVEVDATVAYRKQRSSNRRRGACRE